MALEHTPVKRFRAGVPVVIEATLPADSPGKLNLWYRRVNQAEKWVAIPMESTSTGFRAEIPGAYGTSPYPLNTISKYGSIPATRCYIPVCGATTPSSRIT